MFPFPFSFIAPVADIPVDQIANLEAMSFNGTDQYITFPEFSISNAFTLSCWINPDTVGSGFHAIVADGSVTNTYIRFGDAGGGTLIDVVISGNGSGGSNDGNNGSASSSHAFGATSVTMPPRTPVDSNMLKNLAHERPQTETLQQLTLLLKESNLRVATLCHLPFSEEYDS